MKYLKVGKEGPKFPKFTIRKTKDLKGKVCYEVLKLYNYKGAKQKLVNKRPFKTKLAAEKFVEKQK